MAATEPVRLLPPARDTLAVVVVAYGLALEHIRATLRPLATLVARAIIVDNRGGGTARGGMEEVLDGMAVTLISNTSNVGIGAALNQGIGAARTAGAQWILMLDEDSALSPPALERMLVLARDLSTAGQPLAAVAADFVDRHSGHRGIYPRIMPWGIRRVCCATGEDKLSVDYLMTAGSLVPVQALDVVGPMRADFFMDYVDTEWCLRARSRGLGFHVACGAVMEHALGESTRLFTGLPWRAPVRHYYAFRNSLVMFRLPHVPAGWVMHQMLHLVRLGVACMVSAPDRRQQACAVWRGCLDGLRQRLGRADGAMTGVPRS